MKATAGELRERNPEAIERITRAMGRGRQC